jgi:hypothetical protein
MKTYVSERQLTLSTNAVQKNETHRVSNKRSLSSIALLKATARQNRTQLNRYIAVHSSTFSNLDRID